MKEKTLEITQEEYKKIFPEVWEQFEKTKNERKKLIEDSINNIKMINQRFLKIED